MLHSGPPGDPVVTDDAIRSRPCRPLAQIARSVRHSPDPEAGGERIGAGAVDYALVFVYFAVVMLIGLAARRRISDSLDFFMSGRSLTGWITGLAFMSANLGAVEIIGMSANGAEYGMPTMHYWWSECSATPSSRSR